GKVAVEADDHRLEAQVPERVERDVAHRPEIGLVDNAVVSERAAARTTVEPPADDPTAILVENHRQHAIESAGRVKLLETESGHERVRVETNDLEGKPLGRRMREVQHGFVQDEA